ncbi:hypothetical protein M9Y10_036664 [Tritrichomonas musculus]|uniref:Uncharacterized protein n=1 Tax=Tritrichomonas musculus TaxID=1915356 RepID=A0ABR2GTI7_9EUKA
MDYSIDISTVKNYLRSLYSNIELKDEAEEFFKNIINSESHCPSLLEILIEIIIQDQDKNMKKISIIVICQMKQEFIVNSIFLLHQKADPIFYSLIEILTDFIALKKNVEMIPIINQALSSSNDLTTVKAILQIISSINFKIENKDFEIENYENILTVYYNHFTEFVKSIILQETIDMNHEIVLYYYLKAFFKTIRKLNGIDNFYPIVYFCLNSKINDQLFREIIEMVIKLYSYLMNEADIRTFEFIKLFDEYCKATNYLPNSSIQFFGNFIKYVPSVDLSSFDAIYFISNYIFPFFKFQAQLLIDDPEKFIDEFDPDVFSGLPLRKFINNFISCIKFEPLYDPIYQFTVTIFDQFIGNDSCQVSRILHFFSTFYQSVCDLNKHHLIDFLRTRILPLMNKIQSCPNPDLSLIISVCVLIKRIVSYSFSNVLNEQQLFQSMVNFLRMTILTTFECNENVNKLIFYFAINAVVSVSRMISMQPFNFNENEVNYILMNVCKLFTEINNNTLSSSFEYLIENLIAMNVSVRSFVKMVWSLLEDSKIESECSLFDIITALFHNCRTVEEQQSIFIDVMSFISNDIEAANEIFIVKYYLKILRLLVHSFTKTLLTDNEKVPLFLSTVGKFLYTTIFNINAESFHLYLVNSDGFDELVTRLKYFILPLIQFTNDSSVCIELILNQFLIPIVIKLNELALLRSIQINFTGFNSILIKFKSDDIIFQHLFNFYNEFIIQSNFDDYSKSNFLASLIVSKPSFLFQNFNNDFFYAILNVNFLQLKFDLHLYALKSILEFLSSNQSNQDILSAIAQNFLNRVQNDGLYKNGQFAIIYQPMSSIYHYNIYEESFDKVFLAITQLLKNFGIEIPFS